MCLLTTYIDLHCRCILYLFALFSFRLWYVHIYSPLCSVLERESYHLQSHGVWFLQGETRQRRWLVENYDCRKSMYTAVGPRFQKSWFCLLWIKITPWLVKNIIWTFTIGKERNIFWPVKVNCLWPNLHRGNGYCLTVQLTFVLCLKNKPVFSNIFNRQGYSYKDICLIKDHKHYKYLYKSVSEDLQIVESELQRIKILIYLTILYKSNAFPLLWLRCFTNDNHII